MHAFEHRVETLTPLDDSTKYVHYDFSLATAMNPMRVEDKAQPISVHTIRLHGGGSVLNEPKWNAICLKWITGYIIFLLLPTAHTSAHAFVQDSKGDDASSRDVDFERDVLPLLREHCLVCHGPEEQEAGLRLDQREALLKGGFSGEPAIIPGDAKSSLLMRLVDEGVEGLYMPPDGDSVPEEAQAILRAWIDSGAKMPESNVGENDSNPLDHWSLRPVVRPPIPAAEISVGNNPIDRFVGRRLLAEGLQFSPEADRLTQLRRLSFVLLGVPPSIREIDEFLGDQRPDAYERLVDRLLADPRYGERWASHWLDIARFGETDGFETNRERPNAYHYRDYVIDSFNADLPYNDFVKQQIAGDVLDAPMGTSFLVAGPYDIVKSPDRKLTLMQRQDELTDIVNTTGTAFMGLTLGCARCHNHKFDPISQKDFYAIQAVFAGVSHGESTLPPVERDRDRREELAHRIQSLREVLADHIVRPVGPLLIPSEPTAHPLDRGIIEKFKANETTEIVEGLKRGQRDDAGARDRIGNISRGYRWWSNRPGKTIFAYQPQTKGRYRVWLSWGCGWPTHSRNVEYFLDRDGDLSTTEDQQLLARIDQRRFAGHAAESPISDTTTLFPNESRWSGFENAGVHDLRTTSIIFLRGGTQGEAVTADWLLLDPVSEEGQDPHQAVTNDFSQAQGYRRPVSARRNIEDFASRRTNSLRFTIRRTSSNSEPCIDELEIWSGDRNVALASFGTTVKVSGTLPGYDIHRTEHLNDGEYGNDHSWISNTPSTGTIEFRFPETIEIERVVWGRDRTGRYADRLPIDYRIEVVSSEGDWEVCVDSSDRLTPDHLKTSRVAFAAQPNRRSDKTELDRQLRRLEVLIDELERLSEPLSVYAGSFTKPEPVHRLYRGDPLSPREQVLPETLKIFPALQLAATASDRNRRERFAESIASTEHPLTARVIVNRLWQHTFGQGIVATPSDFGTNGIPPTHPELIDWMAADLMHPAGRDPTSDSHRWSLKRLHRMMLCSHTFRQSSQPHEVGLSKDAGTRLWWRYPPRRLSAESIRDSILAVSGTLQNEMGGPGFSAFEIEFENVRHYFPKREYTQDDWRRMIYMTKVRQEKDSVFGVFDCPDGSQVQPARTRSTTPRQALNLFNSRFTLQQAEFFANRVAREISDASQHDQFVVGAYRHAFGRTPEESEMIDAVEFINSLGSANGRLQFCRALLNSNEFLFIP